MHRRVFLVTATMFGLSACGGTIDTASRSGGNFYVMTTEQAENVMKEAMTKNFQRQPISNVSVPNFGYTAEIFFALDRHAITLTAVPASSIDGNGARVSGYYFSVDHFGSMPLTGGSRARAVLADAQSIAEANFPSVPM